MTVEGLDVASIIASMSETVANTSVEESQFSTFSNDNSNSDTSNMTLQEYKNNLERKRRSGLKNLFEELKLEIPSLKYKERVPMLNILREATFYCNKLKTDEDTCGKLLMKNKQLVARLNKLKKTMSLHHNNK
jgi:hypothetical protein